MSTINSTEMSMRHIITTWVIHAYHLSKSYLWLPFMLPFGNTSPPPSNTSFTSLFTNGFSFEKNYICIATLDNDPSGFGKGDLCVKVKYFKTPADIKFCRIKLSWMLQKPQNHKIN